MPAINFKAQFVPAVETGIKRQSIRPRGKRIYRVGDTLKLYTGQRTKYCRLLGTATISEVFNIDIVFTDLLNRPLQEPLIRLYLENPKSDHYDENFLKDLIRRNGFESSTDFLAFFKKQYGNDFYGQVIRWKDFHPIANTQKIKDK